MKQKIYLFIFTIGMLIFPEVNYAQVDFNKLPNDDLGNNDDEFQELFYEALKQKSIENFDRAAENFQKCIALNKAVPVLYFELGKSYFKLKNYNAAEDALKKAVDLEPDNEWFLDELYGFYAGQNDLDNAIKTVKQLVSYHPDYKEDLASLYVKTKKYDEALQLLDELDTKFGVSIARDRLRNIAYEATGRKKDQIENLESRVENNPDKESNYLALIFRYSENNNKEKAFETAKELLKTNPNSQLVHLALYKFYLDENNTDKAIESMKIVVQSTQIKPEAKVKVLSDFVNFVKQNPQYEADLLEATAMVSQEDNEKSLLEMGQYYLSKNDKPKALEYFEKALAQDSNNFAVLKNILLLQIDLQDYKQVEEKSTDALEKYPSQPLLYLINGVALNNLNQPKKAIDTLEIGLDYIIDDVKMEADFYSQLSKAYTLLNNTDKAKTFSDKAQQLKN
ncbi:lipopolysaccharide assembly protein LapB [Algibacter sp. L4_22]|uniref:tetratricopeptide repeat protein n=1 Tax=Algibacter sp. L4_22 TaxID=2942477 RepID=UPI00201B6614|nr:tetratricopeptide repeat protein [Algibacter sp. L4_22]MCL5127282.1 tetratricopeptide repeat protein [Algibacter sp. L4_22]